MKKLLSLLLVAVFLMMCSACSDVGEETTAEAPESTSVSEDVTQDDADTGLWSGALYTEDTEIGEGEKTVSLEVVTPEKTVKFTILTDKTVLGDALTESGIVEGEEGPYGLYIKKVNGIRAVYEEDSAYWSLSVNGEAATTGADGIEIEEGASYGLTYTKE